MRHPYIVALLPYSSLYDTDEKAMYSIIGAGSDAVAISTGDESNRRVDWSEVGDRYEPRTSLPAR